MKTFPVSFLIALLLVGAATACLSRDPNQPRRVTGTVVQLHDPTILGWGLQVDREWLRPLQTRRLRINALPEKYRVEGLRIECDILIRDTIGSPDWGTVVDIVRVTRSGQAIADKD